MRLKWCTILLLYCSCFCTYAANNFNKQFNKQFHSCATVTQDTAIAHKSRQVILVSANSPKDIHANIYLCQKLGNSWLEKKEFLAVVGKNGIAPVGTKVEGDQMTPAGTYPIGTAFGYNALNKSAVANIKINYKHIINAKDATGKTIDKFIDDVDSPQYNSWVVGLTNAKSFEQMRRNDNLYEYGIVVNYNMPAIKAKGSAIFIHVWRNQNSPTAGCIAMSKTNLITTLQWLDKTKYPLIKIMT
jgi:L,D-peptidoglycan transpeptidase YkuD (ErfK/YbiS/YcfS/YnhG family)